MDQKQSKSWSRYTSTSHIIQSWYSMVIHLHFHSMGLFLYREILCYPTPINFNYWYGIGLLLVFLLVNQVLTGIQVGSYYIVSIDVALSSVDYLMREITYGWSFRYLHRYESDGQPWIVTIQALHTLAESVSYFSLDYRSYLPIVYVYLR